MGSVIATKDAVIPATVGVDIGCGMMAVKTTFKSGILDRKMKEFRHEIERAIPVGFNPDSACPRITRMNANKENNWSSIYKTVNNSFAKI